MKGTVKLASAHTVLGTACFRCRSSLCCVTYQCAHRLSALNFDNSGSSVTNRQCIGSASTACGSEWLCGGEQAPALLASGSSVQFVVPAGDCLLEVLRAEVLLETGLVCLRSMQLPLEACLKLQCNPNTASGMRFAMAGASRTLLQTDDHVLLQHARKRTNCAGVKHQHCWGAAQSKKLS